MVIHDDAKWNFWEAGSGGKKTLFNVCYALAIHSVALERSMPIPGILIIDSPTKNISEDDVLLHPVVLRHFKWLVDIGFARPQP